MSITTASHVFISGTKFKYLYSEYKRGAISLTERNATIICNAFSFCRSYDAAGAIYLKQCESTVTSCSFNSCFCYHNNTNYGNSLYSFNSTTTFSYCSIYRCGRSELESGDSTLAFAYLTPQVEYYNGSYNVGCDGGNMVVFMYNKDGTTMNYSQSACGSLDFTVIELRKSPVKIFNCNVINDTLINNYSVTCENKGTFTNCYFISCVKPIRGETNLIFVDCFADNGYANLTASEEAGYPVYNFESIQCVLTFCPACTCGELLFMEKTSFFEIMLLIYD